MHSCGVWRPAHRALTQSCWPRCQCSIDTRQGVLQEFGGSCQASQPAFLNKLCLEKLLSVDAMSWRVLETSEAQEKVHGAGFLPDCTRVEGLLLSSEHATEHDCMTLLTALLVTAAHALECKTVQDVSSIIPASVAVHRPHPEVSDNACSLPSASSPRGL